MWKHWPVFGFVSLLPLLLFSSPALISAKSSNTTWQTLRGDRPLAVARGGLSGLFPDSSDFAYAVAVQLGLPNLVAWCDVQLTKDEVGICIPDIRMQKVTTIDEAYTNRSNTYTVNGVSTQGWFTVDFTFDDLATVGLKQWILSRTERFDGRSILTVDDLASNIKPPRLWLNIPYDAFFSQHNLSMRSFILSVSNRTTIDYISSPEVGFLRSLVSRFRQRRTKLIFQFLAPDHVEPSTNETYGSLLKNLTSIRTFAAGILVPKNYTWPVDDKNYLRNHTSLVLNAHKAGLEVFAYNFANDGVIPYDSSFDPVAETLSFVDNGQFSVDGVVSDFSITASATMDCFSHIGKQAKVQARVLIISNEGASGDYPGCTDKAYEKAVLDGVDILDCPVQITSDGMPFCLGSINLRDRTNVVESGFGNLTLNNPDLKVENGIFAYDLTWSQIRTLKPAMYNPYTNYSLVRNPRAGRDMKLMLLSDFLALASNASSVSGVLISIENAAYLAQKQGLGITDAVLDVVSKSSYTKKIMIRSSSSAVLSKVKNSSRYECVYRVNQDISDILNSTILEIKKFASAIVLSKASVLPENIKFLTNNTDIVPKLHAFNLSVYVQYFQNEFVSIPWDFFADPYVEINSHVRMGVDGVITDFPATADRYRRNRCLRYKELPLYMKPAQPGGLIGLMETLNRQPPPKPPSPVLTVKDVTEDPLPPVIPKPPKNTGNGSTAPAPSPPNGQPTVVGSISTVLVGIVVVVVHAVFELW